MDLQEKVEQKRIENKKRIYKKYYYNEKNHERIKLKTREKYHIDPNYKKATLELAKNRYHEDEEYKETTIRRAKERYRKKKLHKSISEQIGASILENGIIRLPKGKQIKLEAESKVKLAQLIRLLKHFEISLRKTYRDENKFIQPIDRNELEEKLQKIFFTNKINNL